AAQRHPLLRLPDHPGHRAADRRGLRPHQFHRRSDLPADRPTSEGSHMTVTREIAMIKGAGTRRRRPKFGPAFWSGAGILAFILILAGWMTFWPPYDPLATAGTPLSGPSGSNLLGTDNLGRDTFTRLALAARTSLII